MSARPKIDHLAKAKAAWKAELPDWVRALAEACNASSQNKVAMRLDRSGSMVSMVLGGTYGDKGGDMAALEDRVRGVLMAETVECPAFGNLPLNECQDWQKRAAQRPGYNTLSVTMYRACNRCARFKGRGTS